MSEFRTILDTARDAEIASMRRMGLSQEDAEDVFQDAAMAFYEQLREQRLLIKGNPEGYLHGICRHLALKRMDELSRRHDYIDEDKLDRLLEPKSRCHPYRRLQLCQYSIHTERNVGED